MQSKREEVAKVIDQILRMGYSFPATNELFVLAATTLKDLGAIEIDRVFEYSCVNEDDADYRYLLGRDYQCAGKITHSSQSGEFECSECGRLVDLEQKSGTEHVIVRKINFGKIHSLILSSLTYQKQYMGAGEYIIDICEVDVSLVLPCALAKDEAFTYGWLERDKTMIISKEPLPKGNFCHLGIGESILFPEKVIEGLERLSRSVESEGLWPKLDLKLHLDFLQGSKDWLFFETLIDKFLGKLKEHHHKVTKYLDFLYINRGNLLGRLIVYVGGASKTDLLTIPKYEYVGAMFEGNAIFDAKCYKGKLTAELLHRVQGHQAVAPGSPKTAVIITNNDKVTFWYDLVSLWTRNGKWSVVVVTQALLIEMICVMGLEKEFITLINEYLSSSSVTAGK